MADSQALQRAGEVLELAAKLAFHSKRAVLSVADVRLAGGAPGRGDAGEPLPQLLRAPDLGLASGANVLCRSEPEVPAAQVGTGAALPAAPLEAGVAPHWLAVDGVQPASAENAQPRPAAAAARAQRARAAPAAHEQPRSAGLGQQAEGPRQQGPGDAPGSVVAALPLKHALPDELHLYLEVVRQALQSARAARVPAGPGLAASLATDPGLQALLPYLVPLLAEEIPASLGDGPALLHTLRCVRGLLGNAHLDLLPYVHHLIPAAAAAILTCLVADGVGQGDEHWHVRDEAASALGALAKLSDEHVHALAPALGRVQQTLASGLFADAASTQYGCLVGLTAFGVPVLLRTVMPELRRYAAALQEGGDLPGGALRVRAALTVAVGRCLSWHGGAHAASILQSVPDGSLRAALEAVAPAGLVHI